MKSYTDLSQSKVLAKILPLESADHHYVRKTCDFRGNPVDGKWSEPKYGNPEKANYFVQNFTNYEKLPCWSLAALLAVLPVLKRIGYEKAKPNIHFDVFTNKWVCNSLYYTSNSYDNPVDACYEMIMRLHELKML